jgi:hypothetical protein
MQIGAARPDISSLTAVSGTRATSNTASTIESVPAAPPVETAPPTAASTPLDMDAFFAAWGSDDLTWDVDGSGSVDGNDLGRILTAQTEAANGNSDIEGLLGAWGTADPDWDLNGDGTVNGIDLGIHLDGGSAAGETAGANESMSMEGFQSVWGTDDATYDLNGDGVVNGVDLGEFLAGAPAGTAGAEPWPLTGVLDAWGSDSETHDANGDGTVDGADLGDQLANWGGGNEESFAREITPGNPRLDEIAERMATTVFRALDAEGTGSVASNVAGGPLASFDADGDGQVTQQELATVIRGRLDQLVGSDGSVDGAQLRGFVSKWMERFGEGGLIVDPIRNANRLHGVERMKAHAAPIADARATDAASNKVGRVLSSLGRDSLPPNLSDLLGKIALPGTNTDAVMKQLLAKHPIGGVETTA